MAIDDPKTRQREEKAEAPQLITLTTEQFAQLLGTQRDSDEYLKKQAQYQAEANKRLLRPENEQHPGVSVYRPNGRKDGLALKCKMYWCGYPMDAETETEEELTLLNQIDQVGEFTYHKTDGTIEKFTITGEKDAAGNWARILLHFPCQGDHRHNQPTKVAQLREVLAQMTVPA